MGGWPIAIVGMVLVFLAYELRYTLVPFVFAAVIGFVLDPVLVWSAAWMGGRRWPMAVLVSVAIIVFVLGAGAWVGSQSISELTTSVHRLPGLIQDTVRAIAGPGGIDLFGKHLSPQQASDAAIGAAANLSAPRKLCWSCRLAEAHSRASF